MKLDDRRTADRGLDGRFHAQPVYYALRFFARYGAGRVSPVAVRPLPATTRALKIGPIALGSLGLELIGCLAPGAQTEASIVLAGRSVRGRHTSREPADARARKHREYDDSKRVTLRIADRDTASRARDEGCNGA